MEEILSQEVKALGGKNIEILKRGISCEGDLEFVYKANLHLRTALRILLPIYEFMAHTERDLYRKVIKFDWSTLFTQNQTFAIDSVVFSTIFKHSKFVALRVKDAIVDQFKDKFGERPNVDVQFPDVRLSVHISEKIVSISLDSSGSSLHKRGYRNGDHEAPLNEALAAGIILMSDWDKKSNFYDPMCGSGTLLMEAAYIASNTPPRINLSYFGFMKWNDFDAVLWDKIKSDAKKEIIEVGNIIFGSDIKPKYVQMAKSSIEFLKLNKIITVSECDFNDKEIISNGGVLITNPPYGERLKEDDIFDFYKCIGDFLKTKCKGMSAWIISSNLEALKRIGLKPSRKISLFNGPLECKMHKFELYDGTKRVIQEIINEKD